MRKEAKAQPEQIVNQAMNKLHPEWVKRGLITPSNLTSSHKTGAKYKKA